MVVCEEADEACTHGGREHAWPCRVPPSSPRGRAPFPAPCVAFLRAPVSVPLPVAHAPLSRSHARRPERATQGRPSDEAPHVRQRQRGAQAPRLTGDRRKTSGQGRPHRVLAINMSSATSSFSSWYGSIFVARQDESRWFTGESDDFGCDVDGTALVKAASATHICACNKRCPRLGIESSLHAIIFT